jgi:O-antigen/teichoic acid export membrane protein
MLRSMVWRTLITNCGINVLGLANSVLLSRWLGPVGRGEIAAAMLWPGLLIYLGSMGLIVSTTYFSSLPDAQPKIVFSNATVLGLALSAITVTIGFMALPWLLTSQSLAVVNASRWYLLVIPIALITQFGIGMLQGRLQFSELNWIRMIIPFGYLIGSLVLMTAARLTLLNVILLHLGLNVVALFSTLAVLAKSRIFPVLRPEPVMAKRMLTYGTKVYVGTVAGFATVSLDQILMAALLAPTYLGLYVVAVSAANISQVFSGAVQTVTTPSIAGRRSNSERAALLQKIFRQYFAVSLLISLALSALLPFVVPFVFGVRFRAAVWPAEILLIGSCFLGAKQVLESGALALGDPWLVSRANLVALVVTVVLLFMLLPRLGIIGAAIATTAAYSVELAVVIFGLRRAHAISPRGLFRIRLADLDFAWPYFRLERLTALTK